MHVWIQQPTYVYHTHALYNVQRKASPVQGWCSFQSELPKELSEAVSNQAHGFGL